MINTRLCRRKLLDILNQICTTKIDKNNCIQIQRKINALKQYIKYEYNYDFELPQISHNLLSDILDDMEKIDLILGEIFVSDFFDSLEDVNNNKKSLFLKAKNLINKYDLSQKKIEVFQEKADVSLVLDKYVKYFGKERVIEALKTCLNIFSKKNQKLFQRFSI